MISGIKLTNVIKASCGCIVIPLVESQQQGCHNCILLKSCDGEQRWSFSMQIFESWKINVDPAHKYVSQDDFPRPLTDVEFARLVAALNTLIRVGYETQELAVSLNRIANVKIPD
jgi:hypothetical protein